MKRLAGAACLFAGLALAVPEVLSADSPRAPFTGTWEMNANKSQLSDVRSVTLTVQEISDKIKSHPAQKKATSLFPRNSPARRMVKSASSTKAVTNPK